jgi:hypothetical protein
VPESATAAIARGVDVFVAAGASFDRCVAAIDGVLGLGRAQFVRAEDFDGPIAAIERATVGWVVVPVRHGERMAHSASD